jgi:hypothetical protein
MIESREWPDMEACTRPGGGGSGDAWADRSGGSQVRSGGGEAGPKREWGAAKPDAPDVRAAAGEWRCRWSSKGVLLRRRSRRQEWVEPEARRLRCSWLLQLGR